MRFAPKSIFALLAACLPAATAAAQPCQGVWSDAFAWGGVTGSWVKIQSMIVYNDGSGDAIFIAGDNTELYGGTASTKVARFDGHAWTDADAGLSDVVLDFEVFDDGNGPALYATTPRAQVNRWNGQSWNLVPAFGQIRDTNEMAVFDDGTGPALYAGDGKWDGTTLTQINGDTGTSRTVVDDGTTSTLYTARDADLSRLENGQFVSIRRFTNWISGSIDTMIAHDDGSGMMLYAGGRFTHQSLPNVINIAKFDGTDWLPVGIGLPGRVDALAQSIDGSLIAFGKDSQGYMAKWDGTTWTMIEQNLRRGSVFTAALGDIGHGTRLYFGGNFDNQNTSPGPPLSHLALYDGQRLLPIGNGLEGFKPNVARAFKTFDDGSGEALYIGGAIQWAGQVPVNGVARWDGSTWSSPGATFADLAFVTALEVAPNTTGQDRLLAATRRSVIGGSTTNAIEQWDGTTWTQHTLANGEILALHHVPTGPFAGLYAAGNFTQIGGVPASFLARQDTTTGTWSALNHGFDKRVTDVMLLQNATETSLFACGRFTTADGQPASGLARWTGTQWQGITIPGATRTKKLEVYDVGIGPQLFFAGNVAGVWNGSTITPITQAALFQDVAGFDDGSGPAVYFAGARRVLRFSAQPGAFLPMAPRGPNPRVSGVVERVTLNGQTSLFFGDPITHVRPIVPAPFEEYISSGYIAQYLGCGACYADCDQSTGLGTLDIFDFLCFQNSFVNANPYACDCDTSTGQGVCDIFDFLCFQNAFVAGCP